MTNPERTTQHPVRRSRIRPLCEIVQPVAPAATIVAAEDALAAALAKVDPPARTRRLPPDEAAALVEPPKPVEPNSGGAAAPVPAAEPAEPEPSSMAPERPAKRKPMRKATPKPKRQPTGDYENGNCRPPKHGQIKKGEVRNPRGRPPKALGLNTVVRASMEEKVTLRTARGERKMMRAQALFLSTVENGFKGNARAAIAALTLYAKARPEVPIDEQRTPPWSAETDEAIVKAFLATFAMGEPATPEDDEDAIDAPADETSDEEGSDHE